MIEKLLKYWRMPRSRVLHLTAVMYDCHYFLRGKFNTGTPVAGKKHSDRVCDECQRLAKKK
jgi:sugar phosphate permease